MAEQVGVEITVEERAALQALTKLSKGFQDTEKQAKKSFGRIDSFVSNFAANLASQAVSKSLGLITDNIGEIVDASAKLEVFRTQFETILGSTQAAEQQLRELQQFAATTPFQIDGLALATRQLLSFGVTSQDVIPTLRQLGDLAAGTGSNIDELTIPFGRLVSTQKLTLVELDKFADRGINLYGKLSEQTGISLKVIRDEISKGKVPFKEFTKALEDLTSEGGTFFGATQKQSETLDGVISTLNDNIFNFQGTIGDAFRPALIAGAKEITTIIQNLTKAIADNGPELSQAFSSIADSLLITPAKFWVDFFTGDKGPSNLEAVNTELEKTEQAIASIQKRQAEKADNTLYNSFLGKKEDDFRDLGELFVKLDQLKKKRDELTPKEGDADFMGPLRPKDGADGGGSDSADMDARVIKEKAVQAQIQALREEAQLAEEERKLALKEIEGTQTEDDLLRLQEIELQKINIKADAEQEKIDLIQDARERGLKSQELAAKTELEVEKALTKQEIEEIKRRKALKEQVQASVLSSTSNFLQAGLTLAKEGSKAQQVLASADAIVNTYGAANKALNSGVPYPFNLVAMASSIAVGLANVAKINGASFANSGFVGGMTGTSIGNDNTIVSARQGELFLNASDQKELLEGIRGNGNSSAPSEDMMEAINRLSMRPIEVMIDGVAVAKSVRDAKESGLVV